MKHQGWKNRPPAKLKSPKKRDIPEDIWLTCPSCGEFLLKEKLQEHLKVCFACGYHFRISSEERISFFLDESSFQEKDPHLKTQDPLEFHDGRMSYQEKVETIQKKTKVSEALRYGLGTVREHPIVLSLLDFFWMGGSMNSVVGAKFCRAVDLAIVTKRPLVSIVASGGARMQEGLLSLMQMKETAHAVHRLNESALPYLSILTDPTTGGVAASFATLGDVNLAEPGALIGFAGRRVIEQTIREKLPKDFQTAEFCQKHGLIDLICERKHLPQKVAQILAYLQ